MRDQPVGRAFGSHFLGCLAEGQRFSLREHVGEQNVVVLTERVERLAERDEVARE